MTQEYIAQPSMYCRQCGYALFGLSENRCPECGQAFDPTDPRMFFRPSRSGRIRRWIKRIALALTIVVLLGVIFVAACFGWVYWQYHADWQAEQEALAALKAAVGPEAIRSDSSAPVGSGPLYRLTARLDYLRDRIWLISLGGRPRSEINLAGLAAFKHCTAILLTGAGITDDQLKHLQGWTQLRFLVLYQNPAITDSGLVHLKGLTCLENLDLRETSISGAGLWHLQGMTGLRGLNLADTRVQGRDLAQLKAFRSLEYLQLGGLPITDADLVYLKGLPLTGIVLNKTGITDAGLAEIGQMVNLDYLDLSGTAITDAGLQHLSGLSNLRKLKLNDTAVTDEGLKHLKGLTKLRYLVVNGMKVTEEGIGQIRKALPSLDVVGP